VELGVFGLSTKATLWPADTAWLARRAEELGYRSWWAGEHVVLPSPRVSESPMAPTDPILDPLVHLSYVAALTERMELGTGIVILPQRIPLVLAKQAASLECSAADGWMTSSRIALCRG
jgi:alkanesulfonate monooxygenase SsuD/methylene tetrahydromethanopterin reductase-like flavin-dependent oxidoreductase (luciferase family)